MSEVKTPARTAVPTQLSRLARIRMAALGAVTMLIIQYILGMIYNLYGTAPTATKSIGLFSSPVLALHVILGLLLLVSAIMLLVRAIGARHKLTTAMSAVGLLGSWPRDSPGWRSPAKAPMARRLAWPSRSRCRWRATSSSSSS